MQHLSSHRMHRMSVTNSDAKTAFDASRIFAGWTSFWHQLGSGSNPSEGQSQDERIHGLSFWFVLLTPHWWMNCVEKRQEWTHAFKSKPSVETHQLLCQRLASIALPGLWYTHPLIGWAWVLGEQLVITHPCWRIWFPSLLIDWPKLVALTMKLQAPQRGGRVLSFRELQLQVANHCCARQQNNGALRSFLKSKCAHTTCNYFVLLHYFYYMLIPHFFANWP